MSDQHRTYFIIRPAGYKDDGLIQLGQVITDPRKPIERLAKPLPLPFTGVLKPSVSPAKEWSAINNITGELSVGLFGQVVNIIKAEAAAGQSTPNKVLSWSTALLETRSVDIGDDVESRSYVKRTACIMQVKRWLRENRDEGKTIYMITGLKIAKNLGIVIFDGSNDFGLGAIQADIEGIVQESTWQHAYVFAYRLRKLTVVWRNERKLKIGTTKKGGELHGIKPDDEGEGGEGEEEDDEEKEDASFEMENVLLDEEDFGASLPARDKKIECFDEEDNSPCLVIRTKNLGL